MSNQPVIARSRFSDGISWLTDGANLLAHGGPALLRVAVVFLVISLIQIVPMIGPLLLVLISPALSAGLINTFRAVQQGQAPGPETLLAGLTDCAVRTRLLALGVFFMLGSLAAVLVMFGWLSPQMDLAAFFEAVGDPEVMENHPERVAAMLEGVSLFGGLALTAIVLALVLGALYFAVPLVFFWRWPVLAALLFSVRAVLTNWMAFLGFGLVVLGVLFLIGMLFGLLAGLFALALGAMGGFLSQLLMIVVALFVQFLLAAAQWRAFIQVFPAGPGGGGSGPADAQDGNQPDGSSGDPPDRFEV